MSSCCVMHLSRRWLKLKLMLLSVNACKSFNQISNSNKHNVCGYSNTSWTASVFQSFVTLLLPVSFNSLSTCSVPHLMLKFLWHSSKSKAPLRITNLMEMELKDCWRQNGVESATYFRRFKDVGSHTHWPWFFESPTEKNTDYYYNYY